MKNFQNEQMDFQTHYNMVSHHYFQHNHWYSQIDKPSSLLVYKYHLAHYILDHLQ